MCEVQKILKQTSRQGEKSIWTSHRSPAGSILGESQMKLIPLTQGKFAMVDNEDFDRLNQWKWYAVNFQRYCYAARQSSIKQMLYMHREIMKSSKGQQTDHRNHNGLDNQKHNLRICTNQQNLQNQIKQKNRTSKYKGVSWCKDIKKWRSRIKINQKSIELGCFKNEIEAAKIYDQEANKLFKEYALTNF